MSDDADLVMVPSAVLLKAIEEAERNPRTIGEFNVFKGNCVYRRVIQATHTECCYYEIDTNNDDTAYDCHIEVCPRIPVESFGNEGEISQCPLCGCETDAREVDEGIKRYDRTHTRRWCQAFAIGMVVGIAFCIIVPKVF